MTSNYHELNGKPTLSNMSLGQCMSDASICSDNSGCPSDLSAYHDFESDVQNESIISQSKNSTCLSLSSQETSAFEELGSEFINFVSNCVINTLRLIVHLTGLSL